MKKYEWLDSVYSDGSKFFVSNPYPKSGETISIKLRVAQNEDLDHVLLKSKEHGRETFYEMELVESKHGLDYYSCDVTVEESIFHYHFYLVVGNEVFYYSQYKMVDYLVDETRDFKILVNYDAPKWVKSSVFYQIFPDRFRNSRPEIGVKDGEYSLDGEVTRTYKNWSDPAYEYEEGRNVDFYNGDIYGIIDGLDYLEDFGASAIYLNPIFYAPSAHKFDALDYYEVDPHFGGNEAFQKLMEKVHDRDMHLVLDVAIDHTSINAKWFNRDLVFYPEEVGAYHNPDSEERKYFTFHEDNTYVSWDGVETMPKINFESEEARDIIYRDSESVVKHWLQEPYNIDGWRFDVADVMAHDKELNLYYEVWQELYDEIKATKANAMILAEDWGDCSEMFHQNGYDSTMNYFGFGRPVREFLGEKDLFSERQPILRALDSSINAEQMKNRMIQFLSLVPYQVSLQQFNLINSHDVTRIYNNPKVNHDEYLGAVTMLFTFPGAPNVYYGDEKLLNGRTSSVEGARYAMDWNEIEDTVVQDNFNRYQKLAELKKTEPALIDGSFQVLSSEGRTFAYARFSDRKTYIVIVSGETEDKELELNFAHIGHDENSKLNEVFGLDLDYKFENKKFKLQVPAHKSYLIELTN